MNIATLFLLCLGFISTNAFALYTCSISCPDGTSCSASGSTYATCNCSWEGGVGGSITAVCSSGLTVGFGEGGIGLDPAVYNVVKKPNMKVYAITPIDQK